MFILFLILPYYPIFFKPVREFLQLFFYSHITKEYPSVHMERYSFMRITGLEPARDAHWYLKPARLPIPPYPPVIKTAETL